MVAISYANRLCYFKNPFIIPVRWGPCSMPRTFLITFSPLFYLDQSDKSRSLCHPVLGRHTLTSKIGDRLWHQIQGAFFHPFHQQKFIKFGHKIWVTKKINFVSKPLQIVIRLVNYWLKVVLFILNKQGFVIESTYSAASWCIF